MSFVWVPQLSVLRPLFPELRWYIIALALPTAPSLILITVHYLGLIANVIRSKEMPPLQKLWYAVRFAVLLLMVCPIFGLGILVANTKTASPVYIPGLAFFLVPTLYVAALTLPMSIIVANPGLLLSRQRAHWRSLLISFRRDFIKNLVSPTLLPTNLLDLWWSRLRTFLRRESPWVGTVVALAIGGAGTPFLLYRFANRNDMVLLIGIGLTSALVFAVIYLGFWFVRNRPRHIVIPFAPVGPGDETSADLSVLANLTTQLFVERLRHITLLLNMRQVENVSVRTDNELAVFVTSGQEEDFIRQASALGNIETGVGSAQFGKLFGYLLVSLASTRVRGTLQRQADNNVAIWVEFSQRDGRTVAVDTVLIPENSANNVDETILDAVAYKLALKLMVKLGNHSYLASSWESLKWFLDGLDAAYYRNWRHAIACYRQAVNIEESVRRGFGLGYYHLGAALVFQGEIEEGLKYLHMAETDGPPLAEGYYMLALAQLQLYRDKLHEDRIVFDNIINRCQIALNLRPHFPEAHHLMGTVYYQRGRLRERAFTRMFDDVKNYQNLDPQSDTYLNDYAEARQHLESAVRQYDHLIRDLPNDVVAKVTVRDEHERLVRDRMSATHRLADALRCLGYYSEADSYYDDVLAAFPGNLRTLADRAKTYCLATNWQQADEFIRSSIFNREGAQWNKSASMYRGWARAGGIAQDKNITSRVANWVINLYAGKLMFLIAKIAKRLIRVIYRTLVRSKNRAVTSKLAILIRVYKSLAKLHQRQHKSSTIFTNEKEIERYLGQVIVHLDFAIHQYPPYLIQWEQIGWLSAFREAAHLLKPEKPLTKQAQLDLYGSKLNHEKPNYVDHLRYWLAWRIESYLTQDSRSSKDSIAKFVKVMLGDTDNVSGWQAYPHSDPRIQQAYQQVKAVQQRMKKMLVTEDKLGRTDNLAQRWARMKAAAELMVVWQEIDPVIESFNNVGPNNTTFGERWALDVYGELALLLTRLLAEGGVYEQAHKVATRASQLLYAWIQLGDLSNLVQSYQIATLYAWQGFAILGWQNDVASQVRSHLAGMEVSDLQDIGHAEQAIKNALKFVSHHALAIYVQAQLYQQRNLPREAIDELNRVLTIIAPYDPHKFVSRADGHDRVGHDELAHSYTHWNYRERVSGRLQIEGVVDQSRAHVALAECFAKLDDRKLAVEHLLSAITCSPADNIDADLFLRLSHNFEKQNRYPEARTALMDAIVRRIDLSPVSQPFAKCWEPQVLECLTNTGLEKYHVSLENGEMLKRQLNFGSFIEEHLTLVKTIREILQSGDPSTAVDPLVNDWLDHYVTNFKRESYAVYEATEIAEPRHDSVAYSWLLEIASSAFCADDFPRFFEKVVEPAPSSFMPGWVLTTQLYSLLQANILEFLVLQCDLCNNLAFNRTELSVEPKIAQNEADFAVGMMKAILTAKPVESLHTEFAEKYGQYNDTLAWIHYQRNDSGDLERAKTILTDAALPACQNLAIVYYHLARILVTQLERIWQQIPALTGTRSDVPAHSAKQLSDLLRASLNAWRHAHRLDTSKSLAPRLQMVRQRIDQYRNYWDQLQLPKPKIDKS